MTISLDTLKEKVGTYLDTFDQRDISPSTFTLYTRNLAHMLYFFEHTLKKQAVSPGDMIAFKEYVVQSYKNMTAINMLGTANRFFRFIRAEDFCVDNIKKEEPDCPPDILTKEEYRKLLAVAAREDSKLYYIIRTFACTGINYSDLEFITVEAVHEGYARAHRRDKHWTIIISRNLQKVLLQYCAENSIRNGIIFNGRGNNKIIDRGYICRQLKVLGSMVHIQEQKLTTRGLRLYFSRTFLESEKDVMELNELLGNKVYSSQQLLPSRSIEEKSRALARLEL
ncbi:MAG: site-specific integrase [Christensenella sp.]|uniref:site-specific integrase n=1 Tax=Christensenella sp. TaxID=1935934 RepID=UPI002B1F8CBB|nr:site-specific integrase [Christensenella sp.]MEA5003479.1 site-specific integrase [Christensenella sp.]